MNRTPFTASLPSTNLSTAIEIIEPPQQQQASSSSATATSSPPSNTQPAPVVNPTMNIPTTTSSSNQQQQKPPEKKSLVPTASLRGAYKSKRVFKVIIIGDANVGKTCLSFRFCNNRFPAQTEATIGVDFRERTLALEDELIRVQLWDTAGQERYRQSIVAHYYRNVNAVVFVYDVSCPASFNSLPIWINECRKHNVSSETVPHILIGNKCDIENPNRVRTDVAQVFADKNGMAFFETSALADSEADHVEAIFMTLIIKLQQNKSINIQTDEERSEKAQTLLLKAGDAKSLDAENAEGWCC